ncbi:proprotein convertase P-domain-containing protein [Stieleria varia]|uniref:EF hand n=1 Tax=Stieleria varia TaxID=2528005 RepID=A0A5C6ASP5_9BACT|nr:proprotein convertase P-domain-containing protein [Stieleria varia]TWU01214.1 EF hand [Stieleria varia]
MVHSPNDRVFTQFRVNHIATGRLAICLMGTLLRALILSGMIALACSSIGFAQSGLRASLEKLDRNGNGMIEPEEITPLSRPYLEQLAETGSRGGGLDLRRPNPIPRIQEIARIYYAVKNGVNSDLRVQPTREGKNTIRSFEPAPDEPLIPEFGLAEVKLPYTQDDLDFADRTMRSHDENRDGYIDQDEAAQNRWTHREPFADDLDGDLRLSRMELTQRYARRRLLDRNSDELRQKARRTNGLIPDNEKRPATRDDSSQWWQDGGMEYWLTASLMGRFDVDRNGRIDKNEVSGLGLPVGKIDLNRDGELTRDEMFAYVKVQQDAAGGTAESAPGWFDEKDLDGDRQISMAEYSQEWTEDQLLSFHQLDTNADGLITVNEAKLGTLSQGRVFRSTDAQVLAVRKTVASEIVVTDSFYVADVNVQLSISHTNVSSLDVYLVAPDGQEIELFTGIGGGGNHFDETILDDEAEINVARAAAPYQGSFQPESVLYKRPSLSAMKGKNAQGTWQLIIRGSRNDRIGMLHDWKLMIAPSDEPLNEIPSDEPFGEVPVEAEQPVFPEVIR